MRFPALSARRGALDTVRVDWRNSRNRFNERSLAMISAFGYSSSSGKIVVPPPEPRSRIRKGRLEALMARGHEGPEQVDPVINRSTIQWERTQVILEILLEQRVNVAVDLFGCVAGRKNASKARINASEVGDSVSKAD